MVHDAFVDGLVDHSRRYTIEKGMPKVVDKLTRDNMLFSMAVIVLTGYNQLPSFEMYW